MAALASNTLTHASDLSTLGESLTSSDAVSIGDHFSVSDILTSQSEGLGSKNVFVGNHTGDLVGHAATDIDHAIDCAEFLSGSEATDELQRVSELSAKLEAYRIALVARVNKTEVWRENDPNGTPLSYLRRELTLDHREARADLRLAEGLEDVPELAEALRTGRITRTAADLILSIGQRNPQRQAMFPQYVSLFIQIASNGTLSKLRQVLRAWADQVDPLVTASDESDAFHRRYLHISELGDGVKLDGFFDLVSGMKIMTVLNAAFTAEYKATHEGGEFVGDKSHREGVQNKLTGEVGHVPDGPEE